MQFVPATTLGRHAAKMKRSATGIDWNRMTWLLALGIAIAAAGFVLRRGQDLNWDLLSYHFYSAHKLLGGRAGTDIAPAGVTSFLHPAPNVIPYLAYTRLPFPFSAWSILGLQLCALPLLVLIGRAIAGRNADCGTAGFMALLVGIASPMWWSELGTSFSSATLAPLVLAATLLAIRAMAVERSGWRESAALLAAGALAGLATGLKLTNAIYAVALGIAVFVTACRLDWRGAVRKGAVFAAGTALGLVPTASWYVGLDRAWESPLFPFYNAIFRSPHWDPINFRDGRWMFETPGKFVDFLGAAAVGTKTTSEVMFADPRLLVCSLLLVAFGIFRRRRASSGDERTDSAGLCLLTFVLSSFAIWTVVFAYQRYVIAAELLLGATAWLLLRGMVRKPSHATIGLAITTALALWLVVVPDWGHRMPTPGSSNVFGLELGPALTHQPATYLVAGRPNSYVLAFLHPASDFYRIDLSPGIDAKVKQALGQSVRDPIRVFAMEEMRASLPDLVRPFGYEVTDRCITSQSYVGRYVVCDLHRI
jgi:hypothetical protein